MTALLIAADWVVPITQPMVQDGAVVVDESGTILAVGEADELRRVYPSAPERRVHGALLPGLVNAHTHVELSALAGMVPGGEGLVAWVQKLMPLAKGLAAEQKQDAMRAAAQALFDAGTAAVGDVGNGLQAVAALGTQPLQGTFFHELLGSADSVHSDVLAAARSEHEAMKGANAWPQRFAYVQAPHAPYSASPRLLQRLFASAAARGERTTIHAAEDADEIALLVHGKGQWPAVLNRLGVPAGERTPQQRPVPYLAQQGAFAGAHPCALVHMTEADTEDINAAAKAHAPIVLCPRSNLHIGAALPPVKRFIEANMTLAIGTDSLASNKSLSLWDEMAELSHQFPDVPGQHWLQAATLGGAHVLNRPWLGSLAVGKRPGLLGVRLAASQDTLLSTLTSRPPSNISWVVEP
ncbi:MAG: amidohydrolase family protein [Deltaproteobacteria bacterium]|nr:amidohydrolase family protein [Deltaproteobacteria bacterium]